MNTLHDYLQTFVSDLQQVLNDQKNDEKLVAAVKEKWQSEDDLRRNFVLSCQLEAKPGESRKGVHRLIDTGDENTGSEGDENTGSEDDDTTIRVNEPVGKK